MRWKYYIPHTWAEGSRTPWAEIWLLPEDDRFSGKSVCLTIDALGDASDPTHGSDRAAFQKTALEKLGDHDHWIHGAEMVVRARDFTKEEFFAWVAVWLTKTGSREGQLVAGSRNDFSGSNPVATLIDQVLPPNPSS